MISFERGSCGYRRDGAYDMKSTICTSNLRFQSHLTKSDQISPRRPTCVCRAQTSNVILPFTIDH